MSFLPLCFRIVFAPVYTLSFMKVYLVVVGLFINFAMC